MKECECVESSVFVMSGEELFSCVARLAIVEMMVMVLFVDWVDERVKIGEARGR